MRQAENGSLGFSPEFEKLKKEVEELRSELSALVFERDEHLFVICKNIEMEYMLSIGCLEYKEYQLECEVLRLKRKISLIQAKKNFQKPVVLYEIEEELDIEFAEYAARLNERLERMNAAIERSHGHLLSGEEERELKQLYRAIVKLLHPDLNPGLSEAQIHLFQNSVSAYELCDLDGLRIISEIISEQQPSVEKLDSLSQLEQERDRLTRLVKVIRDHIEKIKSEYPYTMIELIQDPEKKALRKSEIEGGISHLKEVRAMCLAKIEEMLG